MKTGVCEIEIMSDTFLCECALCGACDKCEIVVVLEKNMDYSERNQQQELIPKPDFRAAFLNNQIIAVQSCAVVTRFNVSVYYIYHGNA